MTPSEATQLRNMNAQLGPEKQPWTQSGERVVFKYYAVEDEEKFTRMTADDAREFGRLEYRATEKKWKHHGGIHHVRARMAFEDCLRRFGLRELRVKDGEVVWK